MDSHVHALAVPYEDDALARCFAGSSFSRRCFSSALLSLRLRSGQALRPPGSSCQGQRTRAKGKVEMTSDRTSPFPLSPSSLPCPLSRGVLAFGLCLLPFDLRVRRAVRTIAHRLKQRWPKTAWTGLELTACRRWIRWYEKHRDVRRLRTWDTAAAWPHARRSSARN